MDLIEGQRQELSGIFNELGRTPDTTKTKYYEAIGKYLAVEQLGTGIQRVLKYYGEECFHFTENFTRVVFPIQDNKLGQELGQKSGQELGEETYFTKILFLLTNHPMSRKDLSNALGLKSISGHLNRVISELHDKRLSGPYRINQKAPNNNIK